MILPAQTLATISRQVVGVADHRERLLAARQHLKRGLLLYGPPGVGKTHSVRYLTSQLAGVSPWAREEWAARSGNVAAPDHVSSPIRRL